jgi:hypothetical protein
MAGIVYTQNEDSELLKQDDAYVHSFRNDRSFLDACDLVVAALREGQEGYEWSEEAIREMMKQFVAYGSVDLLNGRYMYLIPWDGKTDALAVARAYDSKLRRPEEKLSRARRKA